MRKMTTLLMVLLCTGAVHAQRVSYNHDSPKKNQITVMETGSGTLTPSLYYTTLHNRYQKSAASKNKLTYRSMAGIEAYGQVAYAEAIDSALTSRAKIEALNLTDREIDLAWKVEGDKINRQMERFQQNINRILPTGGSPEEKLRWEEYYHVYQCAIHSTRNAFMPNAQRKKEYLRIFQDVSRQNETLIKFLVQLQNRSQTETLLAASNPIHIPKNAIINNALTRWKESRFNVQGKQ